ncbi:MAG: nucleotide-binding universal stress UspA family protein [Marinoscillum sp.]|jgi:nucleotide-binding universal stress UspA family protein
MKKILVPTDFSDCAQNATDTAFSLAEKFGSELHFYHYVNLPLDWTHFDAAHGAVSPNLSSQTYEANQKLKDLAKKAESLGIQCVTHLNYDSSSESISNYSKKNDISLIVMGSHGAKGAKEFFIGSNAQMVVRNADIPVLIIKHKSEKFEIPNILFVSDFEEEMIRPFEHVVSFAESLGAKIHLLYINTPAEFKRSWIIKERMESFVALASKNLAGAEIVDAIYFEEGLEHFCEEHMTSLLAIATHHRKGLSRAFLGSFTETIVNHVKVPVMSFPVSH